MSQQFLRFQEQIKTRINQARKESRRSDKAVFFFFFRRVEIESRSGSRSSVSKPHSVERGDGIKKERTARCTAERVKLTPAMEWGGRDGRREGYQREGLV